MTDTLSYLNTEEEKLAETTEDLKKALIHLRYEGKLLKEQNLKSIQILIYALANVLERHLYVQERIVFPFLRTHIPRHEAAILLLKAEHEEIKIHQEKLRKAMGEMPGIPGPLQEAVLYEEGIYLVTLLRHHLFVEKRNIDPSLEKELREDEKEIIHQRIEIWLAKENSV